MSKPGSSPAPILVRGSLSIGPRPVSRYMLVVLYVLRDTVIDMTSATVLKIARQAAEYYVTEGQQLPLTWPLPAELLQQRACYVSIYENPGRRPRAMYGHPLPQQKSLAEEIAYNTVQAIRLRSASRLRKVDLSYLGYSVAILGPLERITSPVHLDPGRYGLYIRSDRDKSAVILPQRTGIETPEDQIATAMRESGIEPSSEAISMYRFLVTHYD